ncbi:hypothetical protein [Streptomyces sp. NPDC056227]|uniref:hypothetical protein n=1 Tax=Streptomyces sp. NPDC056227 TaxID=3345753 RepID=UPI0035DF6777
MGDGGAGRTGDERDDDRGQRFSDAVDSEHDDRFAAVALSSAVIVALLQIRENRRLEERKRHVQLLVDACQDAWRGLFEHSQSEIALRSAGLTEERRRALEEQQTNALGLWISAKFRLAMYGDEKIGSLMAELEQRGGFSTDDPRSVYSLARVFAHIRAEVGRDDGLRPADLHRVMVGNRVPLAPGTE